MNWPDERYVRLYTRDTVTWKSWHWETRSVFMALLRKVDRAGVLECGGHGIEGIAMVIEIPADVVDRAVTELRKSGTVIMESDRLVMPKFVDAQESRSSGKLRQSERRERARIRVRTPTPPPFTQADVTAPAAAPKPDKTPKASKPSKAPAVEGYQETVDAFDAAYRAEYRTKPTWNGKSCATIKRLVKEHGASTVQARIAALFKAPPTWLQPPFDVGTLAAHFDKLVQTTSASQSNGRRSGRFEPTPDLDYSKPPWEA